MINPIELQAIAKKLGVHLEFNEVANPRFVPWFGGLLLPLFLGEQGNKTKGCCGWQVFRLLEKHATSSTASAVTCLLSFEPSRDLLTFGAVRAPDAVRYRDSTHHLQMERVHHQFRRQGRKGTHCARPEALPRPSLVPALPFAQQHAPMTTPHPEASCR